MSKFSQREENQCVCYVGVCGWSYEDWKGQVYPEPSTHGFHPLRYLAQWINCIEVNVTHYRPVSVKTVHHWLKQIVDIPEFYFTVKLWNKFTHEINLSIDPESVRTFIEPLQPLIESGRFGCLLIQFPHRFHRTPPNRTYLSELTDAFQSLPIAVEFRHYSWYHPQVLKGLQQRGIAFCNIDQPIVSPTCLPPTEVVTADFAYVRFHGRNSIHWFSESSNRDERYNYLYSDEELDPWVERIQRMRMKTKRIFILMNNHFAGKALINAVQLRKKLGYPIDTPLPYTLGSIQKEG